jgi:hypothetical protein
VSTDRTSFVKVIRNSTTSTTSRVYATLDRNVCSTLLPSQVDFINLDGEEDLINLEGYKNVFPHAVLQIRWEGDSPRWLEELNASHLIERINEFSMYPHAVATLVPSQVSKLPYWVSPPRKKRVDNRCLYYTKIFGNCNHHFRRQFDDERVLPHSSQQTPKLLHPKKLLRQWERHLALEM